MQPAEEQLTALGNYRDIIDQHLPEIAESIGVPRQTLRAQGMDVPLWTVGERRTLVKLRDCPSINVDRYCWLGLYALRHPSPG